ncbi:hypothetical protein P7C00_04530 [Pseudomonas sp. JDS08PS003]
MNLIEKHRRNGKKQPNPVSRDRSNTANSRRLRIKSSQQYHDTDLVDDG